MDITSRQKSLILGVVADCQEFAAWESPGYGFGPEKRRKKLAEVGMVPADGIRWCGMAGSPADRVQISRLYKRMETLGLIERHALGRSNRTSHISLTPDGERIATTL